VVHQNQRNRMPSDVAFAGELEWERRTESLVLWLHNARFCGVALSWHEFLRMQEP
jgi:hypothetical protein